MLVQGMEQGGKPRALQEIKIGGKTEKGSKEGANRNNRIGKDRRGACRKRPSMRGSTQKKIS